MDGRKATEFGTMCKALGVAFDFSASNQRVLQVSNTESRKEELVQQISEALLDWRVGQTDLLGPSWASWFC